MAKSKKGNLIFKQGGGIITPSVAVGEIRKTYKGDSAKRISEALGNIIKEYAAEQTFKIAVQACHDAAENISSDDVPWHNITGNLYRSMGYLVTRYDIKKGRSIRNRTITPATDTHARKATRLSLKKGEMYDQRLYYDKDVSYYDKNVKDYDPMFKPFVGRQGTTNDSGNEMRKQFIREMTTLGGGTKFGQPFWRIYSFAAMHYTKYVETKHGINIAESMMQLVADFLWGNSGVKLPGYKPRTMY